MTDTTHWTDWIPKEESSSTRSLLVLDSAGRSQSFVSSGSGSGKGKCRFAFYSNPREYSKDRAVLTKVLYLQVLLLLLLFLLLTLETVEVLVRKDGQDPERPMSRQPDEAVNNFQQRPVRPDPRKGKGYSILRGINSCTVSTASSFR